MSMSMTKQQQARIRGYLKHRFESAVRDDSIEEVAYILFTESLFLSGYEINNRFAITVYGQPIMLPLASFKLLAQLAITVLHEQQKGWTNKDKVGGDNASRYIHRLRGEIDEQIEMPGVGNVLIMNDATGNYRLSFTKSHIFVDPDISKINDSELLPELVEFL